jgi:hypothetical protein
VLRRKLLIERYLRMVLKLKQGKMQLDTIRTQIQQVLIEKIPKNYAQIEIKQNARTCTVISSSHNRERPPNNVVFILRNVHQVCLALN